MILIFCLSASSFTFVSSDLSPNLTNGIFDCFLNYLIIIQVTGMVELRAQLAQQERTIRMLVQSAEDSNSSSDLAVNEKSTLLFPARHQLQQKGNQGGQIVTCS